MNSELSSLELHTLKSMYESKVSELTQQLNKGVPWENLQELRDSLSELSSALYDKVQTSQGSHIGPAY